MSLKAYALTTKARFIAFAGLTNLSAAEETVVEIIINSVTEYIENYCQRRFKETLYTEEVYDGDGSEFIMLKQYPLKADSTVTLGYRSSTVNKDNWGSIDSEDYFIDYNSGTLEIANGHFTNQARKFRVTYTAGFDFDNSTTFLADTTAGDIEYATWKLCETMWARRKGGVGVKAEKLGDYSVTYAKAVFESPEIKEVLDKYARVSVGGLRT